MHPVRCFAVVLLTAALTAAAAPAAGPVGYYRHPALHKDTLVSWPRGTCGRCPPAAAGPAG
jgi:hypothetical protein